MAIAERGWTRQSAFGITAVWAETFDARGTSQVDPAMKLPRSLSVATACVFWLCGSACSAAGLRESVSVDTDSAVVKKMRTVGDYLAEQQWAEAVGILRQIADEHGDSLIEVSPRRYLNVGLYCHMVLAKAPAECLKVYRDQVDPQARNWFDAGRAGRDCQALRRLIRHAFASSHTDEALWVLGEWSWEQGEFSRARQFWAMLLPPDASLDTQPWGALQYPDSDIDEVSVRARLLLCSLLEGDGQRGSRELEEFRKRHPDTRGTLAGRQGNLAEILSAIAAAAHEWGSLQDDNGNTTFAQNVRRNHVLPRAVDVGAPRWRIPLAPDRFQSFRSRPALHDRGPLSHFPTVFKDMVLVNDADSIYAFNLQTGKPYWPIDADGRGVVYPSLSSEKTIPIHPVVGVPFYTTTLHNERLYARMGAPVAGKAANEFRAGSELIGLDLTRGEGKLVWHRDATDIDPAHPAEWSFEGSPVAEAGRVYVALRHGHPDSQANVACFDAETEKLIWNRKVIASLGDVNDTRNVAGHHLLTLADGRLFYSAPGGAVAGLDAFDGSLRWVVTYERRLPETDEDRSDGALHGLTPCLFHRGTVVAAPQDSDWVMALDAQTGRLQWKQRLPDRIRHLLGVAHQSVILSGNSLWALDVRSGAGRWRHLATDPEDQGYGRGVLAQNLVYWPKREEIIIVDQTTGAVLRRVALRELHGENGGNLTIAGGLLLVAGPDRLVAFGETSLVPQHTRHTIALTSAPGDSCRWNAILKPAR